MVCFLPINNTYSFFLVFFVIIININPDCSIASSVLHDGYLDKEREGDLLPESLRDLPVKTTLANCADNEEISGQKFIT